MGIYGFLGSLIPNLLSDSDNSKWCIRYDGQNFEKFLMIWETIGIQGFLGSLRTNQLSDLENLKWRIKYDWENFENI